METKASIRKRILGIRNVMSVNEGIEKSRRITQNVLTLLPIQKAEYILCFAGYKSEVMTDCLLDDLLKMDKQIYLPKVDGEEMDFYRITSLADLTEGYKGIPEPTDLCRDVFTRNIWERNAEKVVMLLPGVAFDEKGARIGYGKGYYDRYLNKVPCMERIALCFESQMVEYIPVDDHDIPVTTIVTEEKVRHLINAYESKSFYV